MRKTNLFLLLIIIIFCSFIVVAQDVGSIGGTYGYGSSPFKAVEYNSSTFTRESLGVVGATNKYPTVCNLNDDDLREIISFSNTNIYLYNLNTSGVENVGSYDVGHTINQVACVPDPYDALLRDKLIYVVTTDNVQVFNYNGVNITYADTLYNFSSSLSEVSQPHCTEFTNTGLGINDYVCGFGADDTDLFMIGSNITDVNFEVSVSHDTTRNVIYDRLNDYFYFISTDNRGFQSVDVSGGTLGYETNMDNLGDYNRYQQPISSYSISGTQYVCGGARHTTGLGSIHSELNCFANNQTVFLRSFTDGSSTTRNSKPIFYDVDIDGNIDVCIEYKGDSNPSNLRCVDMTNSITSSLDDVFVDDNPEYTSTIGNFGEIDIPRILSHNGSSMVAYSLTNKSDYIIYNITDVAEDFNYLFIDLNYDGQQEIVGEKTSNMIVEYDSISISVIDTIIVDDGLDYDGLHGFYNPTCTNTSVKIEATECIDSYNSCTYDNLNDDEYVMERLCSDCAETRNYTCGSWSYSNPTIYCQFNTTGTKNIEVNLETDTIPNTIAYEFDAFNLVVSNTNCDQSIDFVDVKDTNIGGNETTNNDTDGETPTDDDSMAKANAIMDNIFIIIGLIMTVVVLAGMAFEGVNHPLPLGIVAVGMSIFFGIISWYPIKYVILLLIGMIALGLIGLAFGRRGE